MWIFSSQYDLFHTQGLIRFESQITWLRDTNCYHLCLLLLVGILCPAKYVNKYTSYLFFFSLVYLLVFFRYNQTVFINYNLYASTYKLKLDKNKLYKLINNIKKKIFKFLEKKGKAHYIKQKSICLYFIKYFFISNIFSG